MIMSGIAVVTGLLRKVPWQIWLVLAVLATGWFYGNHRYGEGVADTQAEAARAAQRQFDRQLAKIRKEAREYEQDREAGRAESQDRQERIREFYRTVEVPADCAAPDAIRGVLDDAVRRANARAGGGAGGSVPATSLSAGPAD